MSEASSSAWVWDSQLQVYHNASTQTWATPSPSGAWSYSTARPSLHQPPPLTALPEAASAKDNEGEERAKEDGEIDGVPIEQVWPDDLDGEPTYTPDLPTSLLRLIVVTSPVIAEHSVAVIPPDATVSIGRDKAFTERLRVKELMVSKVHANLFWFENAWRVADCGSMYGTWVKRLSQESGTEKKGRRLSKSKVASGAEELHHLDQLTVGTTTFLLHIHPSLLPCTECSITASGTNLIPLLPAPSSTSTSTPTSGSGYASPALTTKTKSEKEHARRQDMKNLRSQFLKPPAPSKSAEPSPATVSTPNQPFFDRAAARRARSSISSAPKASAPPSRFVPPAPPPLPKAAEPFAATSKGALLMAKMVGGPGHGLGKLIEPKFGGVGKAGLGAGGGGLVGEKRPVEGVTDWREEGRERNRRRFQQL